MVSMACTRNHQFTLSFCAVFCLVLAIFSINPLNIYVDISHSLGTISQLMVDFGMPFKSTLLVMPAIALGHIARGEMGFNRELRGKALANFGLSIAYLKLFAVAIFLISTPLLLYHGAAL